MVPETDTKFGGHLFGGGEFELAPWLGIFTEARYTRFLNSSQFLVLGGTQFRFGL